MSEQQKFTQQEIAPCEQTDAVEKNEQPVSNVNAAAPAEVQKEKKAGAGAFFKLTSTRRITFIAVFAALAVVVKIFKIYIGSSVISFLYLPCWLAGIFFGPAIGFSVGIIGDALGTIINPSGGAVNPIIMLGNGLNGFIFGCVFGMPYFKKYNFMIKLSVAAVLSLFIVTLGINTWGQAVFSNRSYIDVLIKPTTSILPRIAFQPIVVAINFALVVPLYIILEKYLMRSLKKV